MLDPDPYKNETDPKHCQFFQREKELIFKLNIDLKLLKCFDKMVLLSMTFQQRKLIFCARVIKNRQNPGLPNNNEKALTVKKREKRVRF